MATDGPDERERWQLAFERCEQGACCSANTKYHRPRCPRRAAHMAERRERWAPEMESRSEIGGRSGCIWMGAAFVLAAALAIVVSWAVVYR